MDWLAQKRGTLNVLIGIFVVILVILLIVFFISESEAIKVLAFSLFLFIFFAGGIYFLLHFISVVPKLKKRLREVDTLSRDGSVDELKSVYMEVYHLYMKASEGHKRNFYTKVNHLREKIEEMLRAEKKIEGLLEKAKTGSIGEQRKHYEELQVASRTLPRKTQEKYYSQIVHLRESLENGK